MDENDNGNAPGGREKDAGATGLDWYAKRESANSILNSLVAYFNAEILQEEGAAVPDSLKLEAMEMAAQEVYQVLKNPGTFASIDAMDAVIEKYGPVVMAIHQKEKWV